MERSEEGYRTPRRVQGVGTLDVEGEDEGRMQGDGGRNRGGGSGGSDKDGCV